MEETAKKVVEESENRKAKTDPNMEVSFWKEKYYSVVPVLQVNIIYLELKNQLLREENKSLVEIQRRQASIFTHDKKGESIIIKSLGVNIFVNS
jgi:hypothetical protein